MKTINAGLLNALIPGLGYLYLGDRKRAIIIFITITATFWTGILIGGVVSTVNAKTNWPWFLAQIFLTGYTFITHLLSKLPAAAPSYSKTLDLATIYTGIAGLLNLLTIVDVLLNRTEAGK